MFNIRLDSVILTWLTWSDAELPELLQMAERLQIGDVPVDVKGRQARKQLAHFFYDVVGVCVSVFFDVVGVVDAIAVITLREERTSSVNDRIGSACGFQNTAR